MLLPSPLALGGTKTATTADTCEVRGTQQRLLVDAGPSPVARGSPFVQGLSCETISPQTAARVLTTILGSTRSKLAQGPCLHPGRQGRHGRDARAEALTMAGMSMDASAAIFSVS